MIIHNGFNDSAYGYCESCGTVAFVGSYGDVKKPAAAPLKMHQAILPETEPWLEACACGGRFRANAAPRCPTCNDELSAEAATEWIEENASGTKKGWRWQRSWAGMYCIVIEDRMVENVWRSPPQVV